MSEGSDDPQLEALLDYLKRTRGFDFTAYKRSTLSRRIQKRMQSIGIGDYELYLDYLQVRPDEFPKLFNVILINVTAFFRDASTWEFLGSDVISKIVASKQPGEPIRVWSAGCASGEEAYTVLMLFAETIGIEACRERVKVYATDADEEALVYARQASYTSRQVADVPLPLLEKYFESSGQRHVFHRDLRKSVIFGRHDLIQDAPISRIDMLICRNTLMYFNSETQIRVLGRFNFALNDLGYFLLGKAEMLFTHGNLFTPIDLKRRVFAKQPRVNLRGRAQMTPQPPAVEPPADDDQAAYSLRIREAAFESDPIAQIVVDASGMLSLANQRARTFFGLVPADLGRPLQDLELSYRPVEIRSCINQVQADRSAMTIRDVSWRPVPPIASGSSDELHFDIHVVPLFDKGENHLGVKVIFTDITDFKELQGELLQSKQALETAYEELQSSNEELVTTNEELQSTVEELETTNEELQSTNEELETMNEELQSTNEELHTINQELLNRSDELNRVNGFLESILGSLRDGVIVVDREMHVRTWNHRSEDLWGLRADEVYGRHLLNLDIGFPVDRLKQAVRAALSAESEVSEVNVDAINRRGKSIQCRIFCTPLRDGSNGVLGVIILVEELE